MSVEKGALRHEASRLLGMHPRTLERWRNQEGGQDRRKGPQTWAHALSAEERTQVLQTANQPEFRNLSPKQIVPRLADIGKYLASESTFYRILRAHHMMTFRRMSRVPKHHRPPEQKASGPGQLWSWDITYLPSQIRGRYHYLYMVEDVWSRIIVGWQVHERESMQLSAKLMRRLCQEHGIEPQQLVLHADNGAAMRGATMVSTLKRLGVIPSFSRPACSDDNPFSEALFRTLKYRPEYPRKRFATLQAARDWVERFVHWYNTEHLHSGIGYVTPDSRHRGNHVQILEQRKKLYQAAQLRHPRRWSKQIRAWDSVPQVWLHRHTPNRTPQESAAA